MNLQAIRAEIEAKRKDDDKPNLDYTYSINEGYNQAIDEVLAKLDSHIEPKSEPTEAGLWQCAKNGVNHIIDVAEGLNYPEYCKGGQWAKMRGI